MSRATKRAQSVAHLWGQVPTFECAEGCSRCCGVVLMSRAEEAVLERDGVPVPTFGEDLVCSALKDGKCSIYAHRPLICRLFGTVRHPLLTCPVACRPEHPMSHAKSGALIAAMEKIK